MGKLYFRYGTMNSSKTANLLMVAYNYRSIGKKIFLFKPMIDTRFSPIEISSRTGLSEVCDGLLNDEFEIACGKDSLNLKVLQKEGKNQSDIESFLLGNKALVGNNLD